MQSDNTTQTQADNKNISFGARLKTAREAMGLERKDAAAQLRLNEKYLIMMEKDRFEADLPMTFARGYLKTYAKFLQIPEFETRKALEILKPIGDKQLHMPLKNLPPVSTGRYFTQLFTYLVIFTMLGLAGAWWYTHPDLPSTLLAQGSLNFTKSANKADVATTTAATSTTAPTQDAPANVPIANTQSNAPVPTDKANTITAPVQAAPGTILNTPNTADSTNKMPINAEDVDNSIAPAVSQARSTGTRSAASKQPAYMNNNTNDDPLKNT